MLALMLALPKFTVADLIRLGLHLNDVRLQFVVVLYPSLLFEEGTFFIIEIVQTLIQGGARLSRSMRR
jgi:hypothetical protein